MADAEKDEFYGRVAVTATKYEFRWEIDNFCSILDDIMSDDDYINSPIFDIEDTKWSLDLYPKGVENHEKYIALYLNCLSIPTRAASVTFVIFNSKGETITRKHKHTHEIDDSGYGTSELILQSAFQNPENDILDNGKLIIECRIKFKNNDDESEDDESEDDESGSEDDDDSSRLEDNYETLLDNSKFSDFSLVAEGRTISVHKNILASRSSVFAAMFDVEMLEKLENKAKIEDIKYDVLMEMLRFIYAEKVNKIDTLAGELAIAADKYRLDDLKMRCEIAMRKSLSPDNVIVCLQIADRIHMDKLKAKAIEFLLTKAKDITEKPEFDLLPVHLVRNILRRSMAKNVK